MEGRHLIVSVSSMPPYVQYITKDDAVILQGCYGQLWTTLEERLGFTSQYVVESYNKGVENFLNKRRDVLLRPSVISSGDVGDYDFTYPIGSTWYALYLKDSDEINSSSSYVRNWSMGIWILTGLMICLFTVALYAMFRISEKFLRRNIFLVPAFDSVFSITQYYSPEDDKFILPKRWRKMKKEHRRMKIKSEQSLGNCFLAAISVFCSQGVYFQTDVTSARLLILSFLLFGMIMFNSYSALLVSQLTLGERFLSFETLEEIPDKGEGYALCVRPESYPYLYFTVNNSGLELLPKWANIINRTPCPKEGALSLAEMCQPFVAFLEAPAVMNEYILNNVNCKMTSLKEKYFHGDLSLMLLKGTDEKARKQLNTEWVFQHKFFTSGEGEKA